MDPLLYMPPNDQDQMDVITLNDALAVCIDSLTLMEHAHEHCKTESLRQVFAGLIKTKRELIKELEEYIEQHYLTPTHHGTFTGDMRQWFLSARELFTRDIDDLLLNQLYQYEIRNMQMLQQAITLCEREESIEELKFAKRLIEMHVDTLASLKK